jgi:predicted dehydrogenase
MAAMSGSSLRAAVIGSGFGAHHLKLLRAAGVSVEWLVYAHDHERAAAAARQWEVPNLTTDLASALADGVDLLTVASPPATHLDAVLDAAPHVRWLACDKPLTLNAEQAGRANRMVHAAGTNSLTFYQWRSHRGLCSLRDRIGGEANGPLRHLRVEFLHDFLSAPETAWAWRHDPLHAGAGAFTDLGVHALDLICWLGGGCPTVLTASSSVSWQERRVAGGVIPGTTEDVGTATLRLSARADASLVVSRAATGMRRLRVVAVSAFGVDEVAIDPDDCDDAVDNPYAIWLQTRGDDDRTPSFEEGVRVQRLLDEILRRAAA